METSIALEKDTIRNSYDDSVEGIKHNFTKKEIEQADKARRLCVTVGCPS
jgi:hypothetical protein